MKETINNLEGGLSVRTKLNNMFDEVYTKINSFTSQNVLISKNTISVVDNTTYLTATISPSLVEYLSLGESKSLTATPITLDPIPNADARFDLIYIDTNINPDEIKFKTGTEDANPVQPSLVDGEIAISYIYISAEEILTTPAFSMGVVYLRSNGNETNDGLSEETAVSTIATAQSIMAAKSIKVLKCNDNGTYSISNFPTSINTPTYYEMPNVTLSFTTGLSIAKNYVINCHNIVGNITFNGAYNTSGLIPFIKANIISNITVSSNCVLNLPGTTRITSLTLGASSRLYCNAITVTPTTSIHATAIIQGIINGILYPIPNHNDLLNKEGGDGNHYFHTGKEIDTSSAVQYGTIEYNGSTKYIHTDRYIFGAKGVRIGTDFSSTGLLSLKPLINTQRVIDIKAIDSQTADFINVKDKDNNELSKLDVNGYLTAKRFYLDITKYIVANSLTNSIDFIVPA